MNLESSGFHKNAAILGDNTGKCTDFDRIASPYIKAAEWEQKTGEHVSSRIGTNNAVDMHAAAARLAGIIKNCTRCGEGVCQFASVDSMPPLEVLLLSEVEGE